MLSRKNQFLAVLGALALAPWLLAGCGSGNAKSSNAAQNANAQTSAAPVHGQGEFEQAVQAQGGKKYSLDPNLPHAYSKPETASAKRRVKLEEMAPDFSFTTLDGKKHKLSDYKGKAALFIFADTSCPCVMAYKERLLQINDKFASRGLNLIYVFSNGRTEKRADVEKFVNREKFPWPCALDLDQKIMRLFEAQCSTESFLFDGKGRLRYHGRIDNDTFEPGAVTERDLQSAVVAVLDGRAVPTNETKAFACAIPPV